MIKEFQLPQLLQQLEADRDLAPEVAACRECWKVNLELPSGAKDSEAKKRKLSTEELVEEKKKKEEQKLLHEIRSLGDLLENSDFCVDSLFPDPFQ